MIQLSDNLTASKLIRDRSALMWTRKIRSTPSLLVYRVVPYSERFNHKSKSKRRVIIDLIDDTADCRDYYTGEPCAANADYVLETGQEKLPRLCSHCWAVIVQLQKNVKARKAA